MTTSNSIRTSQEEPLTRSDVERLLLKLGSSEHLDLHSRNLQGINLSGLILSGADLHGTNLSGADLHGTSLSEADLSGANLSGTDLSGANLSGTDLSGTDLSGTDLSGTSLNRANLSGVNLSGVNLSGANLSKTDLSEANLSRANLSKANLSKANLSRANLSKADLSEADLSDTDLSEADLSDTDLSGAKLNGADLYGTNLIRATLSLITPQLCESVKELLSDQGAISLSKSVQRTESTTNLRLRVIEEPLMLSHLTNILSALTDLAIKCWLIAQERFADLEIYTQTHDLRFVEEAPFTIERISYNSPFDASINFPNFDPKNIAEALREGLDTFLLAKQRLNQAQLDTETKAAQIKHDAKRVAQEYQAKQQELAAVVQKAHQDQQLAQFELEKQKFELEKHHLTLHIDQEKQKLELERQQVALQREQLELENMRLTYAIEAVNKMLAIVAPDADQATRAMLVQTLLPNLLQFHAIQNINIVLPSHPEEPKRPEQEGLHS